MKKILFAFLAMAAIGCSDDSNSETDNNNEPENTYTGDPRLIGTWKTEKRWAYGNEYPLTDCNLQERLIFDTDYHYVFNNFYTNASTGNCDEWGSEGEFSLFSSTLTLNFEGGDDIVTIVNLTNTTLKLRLDSSVTKQYVKVE